MTLNITVRNVTHMRKIWDLLQYKKWLKRHKRVTHYSIENDSQDSIECDSQYTEKWLTTVYKMTHMRKCVIYERSECDSHEYWMWLT